MKKILLVFSPLIIAVACYYLLSFIGENIGFYNGHFYNPKKEREEKIEKFKAMDTIETRAAKLMQGRNSKSLSSQDYIDTVYTEESKNVK